MTLRFILLPALLRTIQRTRLACHAIAAILAATMPCMAIDDLWLDKPSWGVRVRAELLFHQRIDYDDGGIVEMVIWRVPSPVPPSTHDLKYCLLYTSPSPRDS